MSDSHERREPQIVRFREAPLVSPPRPPDPADMLAACVGRLGEDVKDLRADMTLAVRDLAYLRGKIEHLPTTLVLVTTMAASQAALLGSVFAMLKFLVH